MTVESISSYLKNFTMNEISHNSQLFDFEPDNNSKKTELEYYINENTHVPKYVNEYWTAKQRQANSLHEISYRACFKPQLPNFFIKMLSKEGDLILDPFSGRGTTAIESALLNRNFIANDINPLSVILAKPRVNPPTLTEIDERLRDIDFTNKYDCDIDLSMFYHTNTLNEILNLKNYFINKKENEDYIDDWIRMVATNRLTGHSKGFFSVYTLPPNQSVSPKSQQKINLKKGNVPAYKDVKKIIFDKSSDLLKDVNTKIREQLKLVAINSHFYTNDANNLKEIKNESVTLTVTSPPFLNIVEYAQDNWLRCWFNDINIESVARGIVMAKTTQEWNIFIESVLSELYRVTKVGGYVAFEVGEINNGKVNLEEFVTEIGIKKGFKCLCIIVNKQDFTKTANIWGIDNNKKGTNSNRIVLFQK